jgi:shikimate dehydrogenase
MVNGGTRVFGILGNPVTHSLSPVFWNAALTALKLNAVYVPFPVPEGRIAEALGGLSALSVSGVNVTKPFKEQVVPFLDVLHPPADVLGVVNTVQCRPDGTMEGYNTDHSAFLAILDASKLMGPVTLLGAGGAGKTVLHGLCQRGFDVVYWANRHADRQKVDFPVEGTSIQLIAWNEQELTKAFSDSAVIINTTTLGWNSTDRIPGLAAALAPGKTYLDLNYGTQSALVRQARAAGAVVIDGIEFLIQQGLRAFEILLPHKAPEEIIRASIIDSVKGISGRDTT